MNNNKSTGRAYLMPEKIRYNWTVLHDWAISKAKIVRFLVLGIRCGLGNGKASGMAFEFLNYG